MPKLKVLRGVEISVRDDGEFYARVGPDHLTAKTLAALESQITKCLTRNKVKIAVPVTLLGRQFKTRKYEQDGWVAGDSVQHITLTGLHAHGYALAKDDKTGERIQLTNYYGRSAMARRLTEAEAQEYTALYQANTLATAALNAFEKRVALQGSVVEVIQAAMAEQADAPKEPAEAPSTLEDPR